MFFNATDLAKHFGKKPKDFLALESTKEYIDEIFKGEDSPLKKYSAWLLNFQESIKITRMPRARSAKPKNGLRRANASKTPRARSDMGSAQYAAPCWACGKGVIGCQPFHSRLTAGCHSILALRYCDE